MRLLPIFLLMMSCTAYGQELNNPNKLKLCPKDQNARYHNCWGTYAADGEKYVGEFKDDKYHGQGTYTSAGGDKYVGEFKDGNYHGQGTYTYANGDKYVGEFKDGKKIGKGTYTYANGDKYVGEFKDGKKHGQGTYYHLADAGHEGEKYIGEFANDEFHGLGTYLWPEGQSHRGHFKKNKPDGKGVKKLKNGTMYQGVFTDWSEGVVIINWPDGSKYVGEIKAGAKHGRGKSFLTDGSWFDGNYRDNNLEGPAIFFNSETGNNLESIWKENKILRSEKVTLTKLADEKSLVYIPTEDESQQLAEERPEENVQLNNPNNLPPCLNGEYHECWGTFIASSGDKYVGEFRGRNYNGQGTFYSLAEGQWKGDRYVGGFRDGKYNGQGTYTFADGRKLEGIWENGNLVRETNATVNSEKNQAVNDVKPSAGRDANPPKITRSRDRKSVEKKMPSTHLPTTSKQNGDFR